MEHPFLEPLAKDPLLQFQAWFDLAVSSGAPMPDAMTLATADRGGRPSARVVLFKGTSGAAPGAPKGPRFFTNYESRKSRELIENPQAALVFHWPAISRQIRIEGRAEKVSPAESDEYWKTRPRESQIGAWASKQSSEIPGREYLETVDHEFQKKFEGREVPRPPYWGGFRLVPDRFEFWFNGPYRLHDRLLYSLENGHWVTRYLAP